MNHINTISKARPQAAADVSTGMKKSKKKSGRFGFLRALAVSVGVVLPILIDDDDDAY